MELNLYFQMLKRGWWIILLTMFTTLAGALGASYLATPQYEAVASLIVSPGPDLINRSDVVNSLDTLNNQSVIATFSAVMSSDHVYTNVLASLQLHPKDFKNIYTYKTTVIPNSSVLEVSVIGPDSQLVANLANAFGSETIKFVGRLNNVYTVSFLDIAVPPVLPSSPKPLLNSGLAIVLGLIAGIVLAVLSEQIRLPLEVFRQRFNFDNMTGVYNKRYFSLCVEDELAQNPDKVLTIGIVELIGITDLVETIPIVALQKVFRVVTDILHKELRGNDIVGRWNDTSFIIMLPNTPGGAAYRIFERIFRALSQPVDLGQFNIALNLDVHIGGAEYSSRITMQELLKMANSAMEQARQNNDNPIYVWEMKKSPFLPTKELDSK